MAETNTPFTGEQGNPIVHITRAPQRPTADIFGELYVLKGWQELTIEELAWIDEVQQRHGKLLERAAQGNSHFNESEAKILSTLIRRLMHSIIDAPESVFKELNDMHLVTIMQAHTNFYGTLDEANLEILKRSLANNQTQTAARGMRQSRRSKRSTGASRNGG